MKALTLTQPWATLLAYGAKRIETRSWSTSYRGRIAIHAAKGLGPVGGKRGLIEQCSVPPFDASLREAQLDWEAEGLPLGAIIATASLVSVEYITAALSRDVLNAKGYLPQARRASPFAQRKGGRLCQKY